MFNVQIHAAVNITHETLKETGAEVFTISTKDQGDITIAVFPHKDQKDNKVDKVFRDPSAA